MFIVNLIGVSGEIEISGELFTDEAVLEDLKSALKHLKALPPEARIEISYREDADHIRKPLKMNASQED